MESGGDSGDSGDDRDAEYTYKVDTPPDAEVEATDDTPVDSRPPARDNPTSSGLKKRGRMLPLSRKRSEPPLEDLEDKSDQPSDGGSQDSQESDDESHELEPVGSMDIADSQDDDVSQEISEEDSGSTSQSEEEDDDIEGLEATLPDGETVGVSLIVGEKPFASPSSLNSSTSDKDGTLTEKFRSSPTDTDNSTGISRSRTTAIGRDGNLSFCSVCKDVGDVVCCDGCPRVYHPTCIPKRDPSRQALDNDEDPWYCPNCISKEASRPGGSRRVYGAERRSVKRRCSECQQSGGDNPMEPCDGCGVYLHHPPCLNEPDGDDDDDAFLAPPLCSNCRVEEVVSQQQQVLQKHRGHGDDSSSGTEDEETSPDQPRRLRRRSIDTASIDEDEVSQDLDRDETVVPGAKRKRSVGEVEQPVKRKRGRPPLSKEEKEARAQARAELKKLTKKRKKKKKKKKKKRRSQDIDIAAGEPSNLHIQHAAEHPPTHSYAAPKGLVKATPAFFFFLNDNRFKIERVLSRKHKYFNRMPKGMERNELIAREAAIWWVKLRPSDHRRYLNMSMRDFEERVVGWKEEKSIREMTMAGDVQDGDQNLELGGGVTEQSRDLAPEDEMLTYQHHQRLYQDTSVGSKPFTPEPGKSNNRLLLELLQDMRFHPLPMLSANRGDEEPGQLDYAKMSIPYFEVHGPVATSVGDECLGCTRGWKHFCPVLKRVFPAVESRAKLQPPLSSLMATRVGLGLRHRVQAEAPEENDENWRSADPFSEKATTETIEARRLPPIASYALNHPSSRFDDIVHFVEEAVAMKVPEPPRPSPPSAGLGSSKRSLPIHGRKKHTVANYPSVQVNKCGRCRTVIQNDTGCVQCRRAQLVINKSKQHPPATPVIQGRKSESKVESGLLKVQTTMLGRLSAKDSNFDQLTDGEKAISSTMLSMRWSPNVVLPPQKVLAPQHRPGSSVYSVAKLGAESSDEEEHVAATMADLAELSSKDVPAGGGAAAMEDEVNSENGGIEMVSSTSDTHEESPEVRTSKRQQTSRVAAVSETDRQQIAKEHQSEAVQLNKRCLSVASCGILLAMMRRDPLLLFAEPVPANVEAYSKIVPNPIDFSKIRSRVLNEEYNTLGAFISDARLLCTNALAYNPPGTIYSKTAKELYDVLETMQKRASEWMLAIKKAHASSFAWRGTETIEARTFHQEEGGAEDDPFKELSQSWPEAVEILESGDWLRNQIASDFMRTKENETAYYGSMAVRRAAVAAEASLAAYPDSGGVYNPVVRRSHVEDEALRATIDKRVAEMTNAVQLKDMPTWREDAILRMLRRVQHRRVEGRISSKNGCARCDGVRIEQEANMAMRAESVRWGRNKRKGEVDTVPRVDPSRLSLSTGLGSVNTRKLIDRKRQDAKNAEDLPDSIGEVGVIVRGSSIHGWGLFAEQPFKAGDVVAEYVGEYVSHAVADAREKIYQEKRIQDYQFRADEMVIDATMKGGHGRYINHNCDPNCVAKIVEGMPPNRHLKRVIIIAQRSIKPREEITYDYQFPLELDLDARIPCNCGSPLCRGFMNWDLPEKGSKNRVVRPTRRGGNMRDRIRRLGRPLKR